MAAGDPPHDRAEAGPAGIVHAAVAAKASENGLAERPGKTVAAVLTTAGVREYAAGNLARSGRYNAMILIPES